MATIIHVTKYKAAKGRIIHVVEIDGKNQGICEQQNANFISTLHINTFQVQIDGNKPPSKLITNGPLHFTIAEAQLALDIANCIHPHINYSEEE